MRTATRTKDEKFSTAEKFSPDFPEDSEIKAEFAQIIRAYPDKEVANAADCSPYTVKCWKAEVSFPQGRNLMKLLPHYPKIRKWHDRRTGGLNHPQSQVELFAELERIMASDTAQGRAMRARLQQIMEEQRAR